MNKILIIEDDEMLNDGLCYNIQKREMRPFQAYSLKEARSLLAEERFDLILLDVNLPDGDGFAFAESTVAESGVPFIFLTARSMDDELVGGFRLGADDYITKPFNVKVVMERIQAVLRRCGKGGARDVWSCGRLAIDFENRTVKKDGEFVSLTPTEFSLLQLFCRNENRVLTKELLLQNIWDDRGNYVSEHTLTLNISRLRAKIDDDPSTYITTVYGLGYRWMGKAE